MTTESSEPEDEDKRNDSSVFDASDRLTILGLATLLIVAAMAFYFYVGNLGLLDFASPGTAANDDNYFTTALDYRERRLAVALTFRTFVSTLGFTVGLVLAAIGGIFILRKAITPFVLSGGGNPGDITPGRGLSLSLMTTSPGLVFALAGVLVMFFTQQMALQVGAPEIYPMSARAQCPRPQIEAETCSVDDPQTPVAELERFCSGLPQNDPDCRGVRRALQRSGVSE